MTAREIITKRLNYEGTEITPYELFIEDGLNAKLAEYYKDEHWREKKLRRFTCYCLNVDTQLLEPIDEVYSRDAFGALWRMDKKPWHLETPPMKEATLDGYKFPSSDVFTKPINENKVEAVKKYNEDNEHYRIINMGWGIFENTWRLRGFENMLMDTFDDEDFYMEICEKITDLYLAMLRACEDVPADAYLLGDDWGDQRGIILGPERWRKFIKPCWEKLYSEIRRQGKKSIQHSCGSIVDIYEDLIEIGMDCHESVQPEARGMATEDLKAKFGGRVSFWGCLGSQSTLNNGTPKEIENEVKRLHNLFKDDGGFVLQPAKALFDEMDLDRAVALIETLAELNG